jgi:hypothetical protein
MDGLLDDPSTVSAVGPAACSPSRTSPGGMKRCVHERLVTTTFAFIV